MPDVPKIIHLTARKGNEEKMIPLIYAMWNDLKEAHSCVTCAYYQRCFTDACQDRFQFFAGCHYPRGLQWKWKGDKS